MWVDVWASKRIDGMFWWGREQDVVWDGMGQGGWIGKGDGSGVKMLSQDWG